MKNTKTALILLTLLGSLVVIAGCGGGGGGTVPPPPGDTTPPSVSAASVTAPGGAWTALGGDATISATVTDSGGVKSVTANVTPTVGAVTLTNTSGSTYQKVVAIPPNLGATTVKYTVVITAKDNAGNSKSATVTFDIPAAGGVTPPSVSASVVLPSGWSWLAGDVTIRANVTAAGGVKSVTANVTPDIGTVTLTNTSLSTYEKVVTIPWNLTDFPITYTVVVTGQDYAGHSGESAPVTFTVPALVIPPPPG